jgi:hypothetical protein
VTKDGTHPTSPEAKAFFSYFHHLVGNTPHLIKSKPKLPFSAHQSFKDAYSNWFDQAFLQQNPKDLPLRPAIPGVYNYTFSWPHAARNF